MRKALLACTGLTLALMAATAVNAQSGGSGGSSGSGGTGAAGATSQGSGSQGAGSQGSAAQGPTSQAPGTQSGAAPRDGSPGETRAQTPGGKNGADSSRPGRTDVSPNAAPNAGSPRTQGGPAGENPANRNAEGQQRNQPNDPGRNAQDRREPMDQRAGGNRGGADATGSVNLTAEKRTTIHQSITREHVTPVRDVNFQVNVGVEVPRTVDLRPLPPSVIEVVPQYRGYRFFVLGDGRIVIVQPSDYKIVTIIAS